MSAESAAELAEKGYATIETQLYEPDPDRPGYSKLVRTRTVQEVYDLLRAEFGEYPDGAEEYFSVSREWRGDVQWPCRLGSRLVVFAVRGSSEGDYVHVEIIEESKHHCLMLGKTFMGRDAAWSFARRVADLLGV